MQTLWWRVGRRLNIPTLPAFWRAVLGRHAVPHLVIQCSCFCPAVERAVDLGLVALTRGTRCGGEFLSLFMSPNHSSSFYLKQ